MLEQLQEFFTNNSTMVILAVVALVAIVGFVMFKRSQNPSASQAMSDIPRQSEMPPHDLEGMDNVNMVCDLANGVCHPQQMAQQEEMQNSMGNSIPNSEMEMVGREE